VVTVTHAQGGATGAGVYISTTPARAVLLAERRRPRSVVLMISRMAEATREGRSFKHLGRRQTRPLSVGDMDSVQRLRPIKDTAGAHSAQGSSSRRRRHGGVR
jgi:hypothetical protein